MDGFHRLGVDARPDDMAMEAAFFDVKQHDARLAGQAQTARDDVERLEELRTGQRPRRINKRRIHTLFGLVSRQ